MAAGGVGVRPAMEATLSAREVEVLCHVLYTNRQAGLLLDISEQTVKNHWTQINAKLGSRDRRSALLAALGQGVVTLEDLVGPDWLLCRRDPELAIDDLSARMGGIWYKMAC